MLTLSSALRIILLIGLRVNVELNCGWSRTLIIPFWNEASAALRCM